MKFIPSVWPSPRVGLLSPSQTSTLRALLARDAASSPHLCSDCRALRKRPDWPARLALVTSRRLFCGGGCRAWHPTSCFSPAQRAASPSVRVCIGREGHVRLCRHVTLSWTTVAALVPLARSRQPHESDWEGPSQALMVAECRHPSHLPGPQHRMTGQFRSSQYRFPSAWLDPTRRCPATGPSPPVVLHLHYVAHTRMPRPDAGGAVHPRCCRPTAVASPPGRRTVHRSAGNPRRAARDAGSWRQLMHLLEASRYGIQSAWLAAERCLIPLSRNAMGQPLF